MILLSTPGFLSLDTPTVTSGVTIGVVIVNRRIFVQLPQGRLIRVWLSIQMVPDPSALGL